MTEIAPIWKSNKTPNETKNNLYKYISRKYSFQNLCALCIVVFLHTSMPKHPQIKVYRAISTLYLCLLWR